MVGYAGYAMPVSYPAGIIAEHMHCRQHAALFDVSHMGQAMLVGRTADAFLEQLVPGDIIGLKPGGQRYTLLTNEAGGIIDDLMVARLSEDRLFLVVNASRKQCDFTHIASYLPGSVHLTELEDRALLALQGPSAANVLGEICPEAATLPFLGVFAGCVDGTELLISRSGYTGEDGFEISVSADGAEALARRLLAHAEVGPAGLGARDTLRLEAGLCLYGNDIDELTSPVEAGLAWVIGKRRRAEWNFPGAAAIRDQLAHGPHRLRVGIRPEGRAPARAATVIVAIDHTGAGTITSGGYSPVLKAPISMGYVRRDLAAPDTPLILRVRGKPVAASVVSMPFVPHRYSR